MGMVEEPHEVSWGKKIFDKNYAQLLRDLLSSLALVSDAIISLYVNGERQMLAGKGLQVGEDSGLAQQLAWEDGLLDYVGSNIRPCTPGTSILFERLDFNANIVVCFSGFFVSGLGGLTISYAQRRSSMHAADSFSDSELIDSNISLFKKISEMMKVLCDIGIGAHLLARSSLHEIALSLTAVSGAADFVLDKSHSEHWVNDSATVSSVLGCVSSLSDHAYLARHLASNLLEYYSVGQSSNNILEPSSVSIDLLDEIERLADVWARIASERNVEIRMNLKEQATIRGNPAQIRQMLHNLLSNAIKYSYSTSGRGGKRFISILSQSYDPGFREPRVSIRISNYGVGILEEERQHLGEPGFRGSLALQEQPMGLGIGVFVAKQIAHSHGGEIKYDSRYLHDTERRIRGRVVKSRTYRTVCTVILPMLRSGG